MSFMQLLLLPEEYAHCKGHLERTSAILAKSLPDVRVYSEDSFLSLIPDGPCSKSRVVSALIQIGVVVKQYDEFYSVSGFRPQDGWLSNEPLDSDTRYVIVGTLMKLIADLKNVDGSQPYFISFYSSEGKPYAEKLHQALGAAGISGFLSAEMTSGASTKSTMISALKRASTLFLIESPGYHTRPVCQVERDYGIAKGARIIRVGTCDRSALQECPDWLNNNIQHENFVSGSGFSLQQQLLGTTLPSIPPLDLRRRAAISLLDKASGVDATVLATKLGIDDQLDGADKVKKGQICQISFTSVTQASRFCTEFDLVPLF